MKVIRFITVDEAADPHIEGMVVVQRNPAAAVVLSTGLFDESIFSPHHPENPGRGCLRVAKALCYCKSKPADLWNGEFFQVVGDMELIEFDVQKLPSLMHGVAMMMMLFRFRSEMCFRYCMEIIGAVAERNEVRAALARARAVTAVDKYVQSGKCPEQWKKGAEMYGQAGECLAKCMEWNFRGFDGPTGAIERHEFSQRWAKAVALWRGSIAALGHGERVSHRIFAEHIRQMSLAIEMEKSAQAMDSVIETWMRAVS